MNPTIRRVLGSLDRYNDLVSEGGGLYDAADEAHLRFRNNFRKAHKKDFTAPLLPVRTSPFCECSGEQMPQVIAGPPLALLGARLEDNVDRIWSPHLRFPAEPLRLRWKRGCRLPRVFRQLAGFAGSAIDEAGSRRRAQLDTAARSANAHLKRRLDINAHPENVARVALRTRRAEAGTDTAAARGTFGAPTFFVGEEIFFGKDRLRDVEEMIADSGASSRNG